jgi:Uma2 family endonuclease
MRRVDTVKPRVSYADLQRMPDDGRRYELYDGELCVVPSPLPIHEIVKRRLFERLLRYARRYGGEVFDAPFDIVLSEFDVVQPDLIYFGPESSRRIRLHEHVRFAPDLAIEVLSPSTAGIDRGRKRDLLARYRVPEYWIVDPDRRQVEQYLLRQHRYGEPVILLAPQTLESTAARGLRIRLAHVFKGLDDPSTH